jgi:hypothetical protein
MKCKFLLVLYVWETWNITLRQEHMMRVFEEDIWV